MSSFNRIPVNSPVLLTPGVIAYAMMARKSSYGLPLSEQCYNLLDDCREGRFQGIITTGTAAKCWNLLEALSTRCPNCEDDAASGITDRTFKRFHADYLPARIRGLLHGELDVLTIESRHFSRASKLARNFRIPTALAIDFAAAEEVYKETICVALTYEKNWLNTIDCAGSLITQKRPRKPRFQAYGATDLPWKRRTVPVKAPTCLDVGPFC